jgi:hypothetical protein
VQQDGFSFYSSIFLFYHSVQILRMQQWTVQALLGCSTHGMVAVSTATHSA